LTIRNCKAPAAALGGRTSGGDGPGNYRQRRCCAWAGAGACPSPDRLPRLSGGAPNHRGAGAARDRHAPLLAGGGRKPGAAALFARDMQGDPGSGPDIAVVLPGASGNGAKALPAASPAASGAAGAASGSARCDVSDGHRDAIWLLATRALRGRIPVSVRRVPVRHTSSAIRVATPLSAENA